MRGLVIDSRIAPKLRLVQEMIDDGTCMEVGQDLFESSISRSLGSLVGLHVMLDYDRKVPVVDIQEAREISGFDIVTGRLALLTMLTDVDDDKSRFCLGLRDSVLSSVKGYRSFVQFKTSGLLVPVAGIQEWKSREF